MFLWYRSNVRSKNVMIRKRGRQIKSTARLKLRENLFPVWILGVN